MDGIDNASRRPDTQYRYRFSRFARRHIHASFSKRGNDDCSPARWADFYSRHRLPLILACSILCAVSRRYSGWLLPARHYVAYIRLLTDIGARFMICRFQARQRGLHLQAHRGYLRSRRCAQSCSLYHFTANITRRAGMPKFLLIYGG